MFKPPIKPSLASLSPTSRQTAQHFIHFTSILCKTENTTTATTTTTMASRAFNFVAATKKSAKNTLYLHCNVKPGASKNREGIASVGEEAVEICVAAQAREGEANKAVIKVLSEV
jgi:hypothetical protein